MKLSCLKNKQTNLSIGSNGYYSSFTISFAFLYPLHLYSRYFLHFLLYFILILRPCNSQTQGRNRRRIIKNPILMTFSFYLIFREKKNGLRPPVITLSTWQNIFRIEMKINFSPVCYEVFVMCRQSECRQWWACIATAASLLMDWEVPHSRDDSRHV